MRSIFLFPIGFEFSNPDCAFHSSSSRLIATYESETSNNVVLHGTGSDGLEGLKAGFSNLTAAWGFLRVSVGNDELSKRAKFVFITWVGPGIKVMRKARVSVHIADVKKVIRVSLPYFAFFSSLLPPPSSSSLLCSAPVSFLLLVIALVS